ncbi:hypothetical protein BD311DRAFT_863636 [Dichomitus squalens]|uniref:Protein kinase domain-containing protein n=1 Tax=Dichomitus squalens TaxID=114155 RepID=A0A4Q9MTE6_9APHY|nr:hypothetical protein BD311DRAFT_863636 [Dichomitus squalens]
MHGKITLVPHAEFFAHFLSSMKTPRHFKIVAHPHKSHEAEHTKQSVGMGMYPADSTPTPHGNASYAAVDWFNIDLPMECKADSMEQDPSDDDEPSGEPTAYRRKDALDQILSYAELVFKRQQRMFLFISSATSSALFNFKNRGNILVDFLHGCSHLSAAERGHDPTATRVSRGSFLYDSMKGRAARADPQDTHDYVRELFARSLDKGWPWWKLEVRGNVTKRKHHNLRPLTRKFLVGKPHFQASGVAGRFTRGYVALPLVSNDKIAKDAKFVFLKDAWRIDDADVEQEGATLEFLNDHKVKHVPTLVCHGDLGQFTESQGHWLAFRPRNTSNLERHSHYRLVVKEVGLLLEEFQENSFNLCYYLVCCLLAHARAFEASIIHRDISAGNILIYKDDDGKWHGLLNDWELSKKIDDSRQTDCIGTWQYMAARALTNSNRKIVIQDELESFFHVLLYFAVRFIPHNLRDDNVQNFLDGYFNGNGKCSNTHT